VSFRTHKEKPSSPYSSIVKVTSGVLRRVSRISKSDFTILQGVRGGLHCSQPLSSIMVEKPSKAIGEAEDRPSSKRRIHLREADAKSGSMPTVSNFFPLERYYEASDKVLQSFEMSFESRQLDEAYVYGMRYCTFCVEGIVHHDYYRAKKFDSRRKQTTDRVQEVLTKLELVAEWMDAEEIIKEEKRQALLMKQREERLRKQSELEQKRLEELQRRIEQQKATSSNISSEKLEESALAKLQRLSQPHGPLGESSDLKTTFEQGKRVSWNLQSDPDGHLMSQVSSDSGDLPPPLLPPLNDDGSVAQENNAPPSYNSILKQSSYFGPGRGQPQEPNGAPLGLSAPSYEEAAKLVKKPKPPKQLPIRQFIAHVVAKHQKYVQEGKIQVSPLRTYQGRISGSTNGCTVISACIVSKHMETHGGVTDAQVQSVIDSECIPLLRSIRTKLDLGGASLIIPSDVHDYLVDHKLLYQHKFAGATGGNVVDPAHLGELLSLLQGEVGTSSHLKAAATLFFREHVISIVKFPRSATEAIFDMIDSLPTCNGRGSRTRCHSLDALKVHLEWYCTRKFSDSNISYIERNRWDDSMADFDPRVFQAFVWADLPEAKPEKQ
jgi:hypothetical protein